MPEINLKAAVFPGQGVQEELPRMCYTLLEADPEIEKVFLSAKKFLSKDLLKLILEGDPEELSKSQNLQPAVAVSSVAALEALKRRGFHPDIVAGHSLGEYPALYAAESISLESMCRLVRARSVFMEEANNTEPGMMTAIVAVPLDRLKKMAKKAVVDVAAVNILKEGREQIVLAGSHEGIAYLKELVQEFKKSEIAVTIKRKIEAYDLDIPYAAHSRRMRKAKTKMRRFVDDYHIPIYDPTTPIIANSSGRYIKTAVEIKKDLPAQLTRTVQWHETVDFMEKEGVVVIFEVGAGTVLSGINKHIVSKDVEIVRFDPSLESYQLAA